MPKADASDAQDLFDLAEFADRDPDPDDGLDLEAYLDLDESPEISRLMQAMRGEGPAAGEASPARAVAAVERAERPRGSIPPGGPPVPAAAGAPSDADVLRDPSPPRPPDRRIGRGEGLDLAAVARALGHVSVQARQLVADCPRCDRASIVIYADRFKCFGCEAAGDLRALAAHLTGWDARRVAAWLEAASANADVEDADVRRPWRLSFFAR